MNTFNLNYTRIPSTPDEDLNKGKSTWRDNKLISIDEGSKITLYLFHQKIDEKTYAFAVRVDKPLTRDKVINNAEMERYHLNSALEVASFNASLARKSRLASMRSLEDGEVIDHDNFIEAVKSELTNIGVL